MMKKVINSIASILLTILVALVFRSFILEPFHIPSGSMKDTLLVGDYIFVAKYAYGYSRYSFPFALPLVLDKETRVFYRQPQAGDVVVFRPPHDPRVNYIKRIIGLPGDTVQLKKGIVYVNNVPLSRKHLSNFVEQGPYSIITESERYLEILTNGQKHDILTDNIIDNPADNTPIYKVPQNHFFVMGDNRDHSHDSRYINSVGFIPAKNLVGKALIVVFSVTGTGDESWQPFSIRMNRLLHVIK